MSIKFLYFLHCGCPIFSEWSTGSSEDRNSFFPKRDFQVYKEEHQIQQLSIGCRSFPQLHGFSNIGSPIDIVGFFSGLRLRTNTIDWLFTVLRPAQEFFTYMEMSPLPVKGCKI
jgi:hypothetical protein